MSRLISLEKSRSHRGTYYHTFFPGKWIWYFVYPIWPCYVFLMNIQDEYLEISTWNYFTSTPSYWLVCIQPPLMPHNIQGGCDLGSSISCHKLVDGQQYGNIYWTSTDITHFDHQTPQWNITSMNNWLVNI